MMGKRVTVIIRCSWCGRKIGTTVWQGKSDDHEAKYGKDSHGICPRCSAEILNDAIMRKIGQSQGSTPTA